MTFRVSARTILHLGAELISSDSIAVYELVKNAFDAGSQRVTIDVVVRMPFATVREVLERIEEIRKHPLGGAASTSLQGLRDQSLKDLTMSAPDAKSIRKAMAEAENLDRLAEVVIGANYIVVSDTGEGMSLSTLRDVFLTIGTRSRLKARATQVKAQDTRLYLGEKGVGRLSAMRLGSRLHVESTETGEAHWNVLNIDWSLFSHNSDALLESIPIEAKQGQKKENPSTSGTKIRIDNLASEWSEAKLQELARVEFSKLTDPFATTTRFPIQLRFNNNAVSIPQFNRVLLENAHGSIDAAFEESKEGAMRLRGVCHYQDRQLTFALEEAHLLSVAGTSMKALRSLGPFKMKMYWYNRRILTALEGIGDRALVKRLVNEWAGGLMVYRDGFRVMPYGGPDDDWLNLDKKALASPGYKVNRAQIIGQVVISRSGNPALVDQTNREGLRDSVEKSALIQLLRYIIETEFRQFLNETDKAIRAREPIDVDELDQRVEAEEELIQTNIVLLVRRVPELGKEKVLLDDIREAAARLRTLMEDVRQLAASYEAGRGQLLSLAGVGLTVEILAHELNRAAEHALLTLTTAPENGLPKPVDALIRTLESQLKTLQKRLRILDPLSTAGRQRKESFDVVALIGESIESHQDQFRREAIVVTLVVSPDNRPKHLLIKAVKGMVVQILENLFANSVYWLRQQRMLDPAHESRIFIVVHTDSCKIDFSDNGPGIPLNLKERVFEAFFTTKPAGRGKGLGLFIGREIARYHGVELQLSEHQSGPQNTLHTFVLSLGATAK